MPARRFFVLTRAAQDHIAKQKNLEFYAMADLLACATGNSDYIKEMKKIYWDRIIGEGEVNKNQKAASDARTIDLTDTDKGMAVAQMLVRGLKRMPRGR